MLRITEARVARGWSQERLAEAIGTTQQTVQRWESGKVDPKVGKVQEISAALGVTVSYLLGMPDPDGPMASSDDESELLELFRSCTEDGRRYMLQVARVTAGLFPRRP